MLFVDSLFQSFSIILSGLPVHLLEAQRYIIFYVFAILTSLLLAVLVYFFVYGDLLDKLTSRFSLYLFAKSKPALESIFNQVFGNIMRRLFVPMTIVASTVSPSYWQKSDGIRFLLMCACASFL